MCLRCLADELGKDLIDRYLVIDIYFMLYFLQNWVLYENARLQSALTKEQFKTIECWYYWISECFYSLLHNDLKDAFNMYEDYCE